MKKVSGSPLPLGVTYKNGRANFAMGIPEGKTCSFCSIGKEKPACWLLMFFLTGLVRCVIWRLTDLRKRHMSSNYDIDGECMTDSYAKAFSGKEMWLKNIGMSEKGKENVRGIFYEDHYDWEQISHRGYRKKN